MQCTSSVLWCSRCRVDEEAGVRGRLRARLGGLRTEERRKAPSQVGGLTCMSRKSRLSQVLEVENRAEEDEAPPPGSKLAQRRSQGPAERQREEGLRAFVRPPCRRGKTTGFGWNDLYGRACSGPWVVVLLLGRASRCLCCWTKRVLVSEHWSVTEGP